MTSAMSVEEGSAAGGTYQPWTRALAEGRAAMARAGCPDPPRELLEVTAFTAGVSRDWAAMTMGDARRLSELLRRLAETLQMSIVGFDERLLELPTTCSEIRREVSATYSIRHVTTPTGKDVWAVLSIQNRSSRDVYVGVGGRLVATRSTGDSRPGLSWQSRSTRFHSPALATSRHALLGSAGQRLRLSSGDRVSSLALTVSVDFGADPINCRIPSRRAGGESRVAAAGDIACGPSSRGWNGGRGVPGRCHQRATAKLIEGIDPDAVFALGDLQYQAGTLASFRAGYDPTWGRFKDITYPVPGNHEYGVSGAEGYFTYFGNRATPKDPGCRVRCRGYYSFDLGSWHVVALNVNCTDLPRKDGCGPKSPQNRWLQQDLKAANKTTGCTVVLMHKPRWSSSRWQNPKLDALVNTMYDNGVDLLLSADSHSYERFAPQNPRGNRDTTRGITQFVVGTGGGHFTGLRSPGPNSLVSKADIFGVLDLRLDTDGYAWSFEADPSTPFEDSGRGACH